MSSRFDKKLISVTGQVEAFWKQLLNDAQNGETFQNGIQLAIDMKKLEELFNQIQGEQ